MSRKRESFNSLREQLEKWRDENFKDKAAKNSKKFQPRGKPKAEKRPDPPRKNRPNPHQTGKSDPPRELSAEERDLQYFKKAMADVTPLGENPYIEKRKIPTISPHPTPEELALIELRSLVEGDGRFDLYFHEEYVEGYLKDIDPLLFRKLKAGDISWQAYIDLHGMRVDEAKEALRDFFHRNFLQNNRCLLIVHGRGLHSEEKIPVLKRQVINWLTRGFLQKYTLAFVSAKPYDGGSGALYVLIRRKIGKKKSEIFHKFF